MIGSSSDCASSVLPSSALSASLISSDGLPHQVSHRLKQCFVLELPEDHSAREPGRLLGAFLELHGAVLGDFLELPDAVLSDSLELPGAVVGAVLERPGAVVGAALELPDAVPGATLEVHGARRHEQLEGSCVRLDARYGASTTPSALEASVDVESSRPATAITSSHPAKGSADVSAPHLTVRTPPPKDSPNKEAPNKDAPNKEIALAELRAAFPQMRVTKLERFLKASNGDVAHAKACLTKHVAWLGSLPVDLRAAALPELRKGKLYIRGQDRLGREMLIWQVIATLIASLIASVMAS